MISEISAAYTRIGGIYGLAFFASILFSFVVRLYVGNPRNWPYSFFSNKTLLLLKNIPLAFCMWFFGYKTDPIKFHSLLMGIAFVGMLYFIYKLEVKELQWKPREDL